MTWLHRFALLVSACTFLLVVAGGLVTSTDSGLAVPDWPNTYGYFMFSFPLSKMVGGIFYEHGHRLIASAAGMLTIGLAAWIAKTEPRRWLRRLTWVALGAVVLQGTLGGITVLYFLPAPISVAHAGLAQIFFCLTIAIALFTSPGWRRMAADGPATDTTLTQLTIATVAVVYAQILVGATMRHIGAGLAIPDFPLAFGRVIPPEWTVPIAVHFAHRVGAVIVTLAVAATAGHVLAHHHGRRELTNPAWLLLGLVTVQFTLGALTVLSERHVGINTAHVATGAALLATTLVLVLRTHRHRFSDDPTGAPRTAATAVSVAPSPEAIR
jgi:cytochrome c oxidase assembly protein subunit 15